MSTAKRTVLIAGMGTSPAVLTNAVWALAHGEKPVVPDEIVVFITKNGKTLLKKELFDDGVWADMLKSLAREGIDIDGKLLFGETSIRSIPDVRGNEIDDLRTGDDNLRAADFMLGELRKYTEDTETTILCSIAGGRKTMSALLFSCMSLLGREQDKVYHVLLPPVLEGGVSPTFYYPKRGTTYTARFTGKKHKSKDLQCELFEVPFVRMRGWYQEKFKNIPPSYRTLISKVQTVAPPAVAYPEIEIDAWNGVVWLNGHIVSMSKPCFAMLFLLANGCQTKDLHAELCRLHNETMKPGCAWVDDFRDGSLFKNPDFVEDLRHTASNLRSKLKKSGFNNVDSLVPQRGAPVAFSLNRIIWRNKGRLIERYVKCVAI